ncbi:hypothetical protein P872_16920 [Rhodonellum psychrophilum GCM71 = DSM 17998]|uniref:Alpha-glucosidase n=2 Tax=Rhodonellum TaxID=336827 RepID=U5BRJ4_9BACT|nr:MULTISPECIES: TIM-barrel domain-containing protein [Rhodonellum]ERM83205.1 hypothetical protein P872_16920 [Rhodonellum psychrophilum GCM71 = DSM 17998]SDZ14324.1 Alpha-glucosidase, glycosyl hydrolase family GH31 [Rhodonellum ikkaensis]
MHPIRSIALLFILAFSYGNSNAQTKPQNIHTLQSLGKTMRLEFYKPDLFRVRTSLNGQFENESSLMLEKQEWNTLFVAKEDHSDHFIFNTEKIGVKINKETLQITVFNKKGEVISTEEKVGSGMYSVDNKIGTRKQLQPNEHFFGFGERMDFLDQRGKSIQLNVGRGLLKPHIIGAYNVLEANYAPVPFFMSTGGYGIFFHTPYASDWDLGKSDPETYSFQAQGQELDYFFIYGPDFPSLLFHYTDLTGRSPLLPRFAHGLHVGTYSGGTWGHEDLTSTQYVVELVRKFREMGIPLDVLHLDSTWRMFGKNGGSGATTFEWRETFLDPKSMFDSLYALDINMVGLHVRPRFDNGNQLNLLDQARIAGHVYPEENNQGEFVNFFDNKAVDWWWENGVKKIADVGAMFLKTDEGSAFGRQANESTKTGPTGASAQKLHNIFPVAYAKAPFEKFKKHNQMRGMNHTREGYAGIQRYPFIWAGDWPSEWQYFAPVIKAGINMGLSGVGYWSHNMGGFEHDADPELYSRWVQFGMFSPIAHLFGMDHPGYKEPWNYGEKALEIFSQYDKLRYRLIPYIYTTAFQQHQEGLPIMRALALHHQEDYNTYNIDDQYYFGEQMIVCPVITKSASTRTVYLPIGDWFDYWNGDKYEGGKYHNIVTPLEKLPIFVPSGAIIPMQDEVSFDNKKPYGTITLEIFPGENEGFGLYEDDGISEAYLEGNFSLTQIEKSTQGKETEITLNPSEGKFQVPTRKYILKIHVAKAPTSISSNLANELKTVPVEDLSQGVEGWAFDQEKSLLWVNFSKKSLQKIVLKITN